MSELKLEAGFSRKAQHIKEVIDRDEKQRVKGPQHTEVCALRINVAYRRKPNLKHDLRVTQAVLNHYLNFTVCYYCTFISINAFLTNKTLD